MAGLSAFGLALNVIRVVDFIGELFSISEEIYNSAEPNLKRFTELIVITENLEELTESLSESLKKNKSSRNLREQEIIAQGCNSLASDLLSALKKLKIQGKNRRWNSFRQALLTIWHKNEIEELEKRVESFRQQLVIVIILSLRDLVEAQNQNQNDTFREMSVATNDMQSIGSALLGHIEDSKRWYRDLGRAIHEKDWQAFYGGRVSNPFANISDRGNEEMVKALREKLINSLRFPEMKDRHERIAAAYKKTFDWVYGESIPSHKACSTFSRWLDGKNNFYWITGKAGSGKSTLIKFLHNDPRTQKRLQASASGFPIVTATFFSWNSGTEMQMSQLGLLRTLLFQILQQCPALIERVLPERWESYTFFGDDPHPWEWSELVNGLKAIIKEDGLTARFCFFIDGLDEFEGDHTRLVELIHEFESSSTAKFCVSSRPWVTFEDAFHGKPRLMLQDLTRPDIELYVSSKFHSNLGFTELEEREPDYAHALLEQITDKASGVFLWVYLVVQSLLSGLTNGDRISDLQARLDLLPQDLESLFSKMLYSLDPFYIEQASQIFQIHRQSLAIPSILTVSFSDEEDTELVFSAKVKPLTTSQKLSRYKHMKRRLNHLCKGLLEIESSTLADEAFTISTSTNTETISDLLSPEHYTQAEVDCLISMKVEYLHRTVKDYFQQPEVWKKLQTQTKAPFNPNLSLCRATILQLKCLPTVAVTLDDFWRLITAAIEYAAQLEKETGITEMTLLDEIEQVGFELVARPGSQIHTLSKQYASACGTELHWTITRLSRSYCPFLHLAAVYDLSEYIQLKMEELPPGVVEKARLSLLRTAIVGAGNLELYHGRPVASAHGPRLKTINMLLDCYTDRKKRIDRDDVPPWPDVFLSLLQETLDGNSESSWSNLVELIVKYGTDVPDDARQHIKVRPCSSQDLLCNDSTRTPMIAMTDQKRRNLFNVDFWNMLPKLKASTFGRRS